MVFSGLLTVCVVRLLGLVTRRRHRDVILDPKGAGRGRCGASETYGAGGEGPVRLIPVVETLKLDVGLIRAFQSATQWGGACCSWLVVHQFGSA